MKLWYPYIHTCQLGPAHYVIMIFMNEFHSLYHVSRHRQFRIFTTLPLMGCPTYNRLSHVTLVCGVPCYNGLWCPMLLWSVPYYNRLSHIPGYRKREIQAMVEEHLKQLITQHFDPKKADLIFTEEGSVSWHSLQA